MKPGKTPDRSRHIADLCRGSLLPWNGSDTHGFQSLTDDCEVFYQVSEFCFPKLARGLRWNDPRVGIQ